MRIGTYSEADLVDLCGPSRIRTQTQGCQPPPQIEKVHPAEQSGNRGLRQLGARVSVQLRPHAAHGSLQIPVHVRQGCAQNEEASVVLRPIEKLLNTT